MEARIGMSSADTPSVCSQIWLEIVFGLQCNMSEHCCRVLSDRQYWMIAVAAPVCLQNKQERYMAD